MTKVMFEIKTFFVILLNTSTPVIISSKIRKVKTFTCIHSIFVENETFPISISDFYTKNDLKERKIAKKTQLSQV